MSRKKKILEKPKPDEWVELAMNVLEQIGEPDYNRYIEERNTVVVSGKMYDKLVKKSGHESA
jgi:hypothetical protein